MARVRSSRGTVRNLPVGFGPVATNANYHRLSVDFTVKMDVPIHCYFKREVDGTWLRGPDPRPVTSSIRRYNSAIIDGANGPIVPDTNYDIRLITNPGKPSAIEWTGQQATRAEPVAPTIDRVVDVANGTELAAALAGALDGDHIRLTGTVYNSSNGLPGAATIVTDKERLLIEGVNSDPAIIDGGEYGPFTWVSDGGGVYRTTDITVKIPRGLMAMSVDGNLVSAVGTRAELDTVLGAAYYDDGATALYLKLPDDSDPTGHEVGASETQSLLWFIRCSDSMVRNIRFRGASWSEDATPRQLVLDACEDFTVSNCHINWGGVGLQQFGDTKRVTIQDNRFEVGNEYMSFKRMKASSAGQPVETFCALTHQTISDEAENTVWRRNEFFGVPNPMVLQITDNVDRLAQCHDIYENIVVGSSDDAIELDGTSIDTACYRNKIQQSLPAFSCAPLFRGVVWIFDNLCVHSMDRKEFEGALFTGDFMKLTSSATQTDKVGSIVIIKNTWKPDGDQPGSGHYLFRLQPGLEFGHLEVLENICDAPIGARFGWFGPAVPDSGNVKYRRNTYWRGDASINYFKAGGIDMTHADFLAAGGDDVGSLVSESHVDEVYAPTGSTPDPGGGAEPGFTASGIGSSLTWANIPIWSSSDKVCAAVSANPVEFDLSIQGCDEREWNKVWRMRQAKVATCEWGWMSDGSVLDLVLNRVPGAVNPSHVRLQVVAGGGGPPHQLFLDISIDGVSHAFSDTSYTPGTWQDVVLAQTAPAFPNIFDSATIGVSSVE